MEADSLVRASKILSRFGLEENLAAAHSTGFDNMVRNLPIFSYTRLKKLFWISAVKKPDNKPTFAKATAGKKKSHPAMGWD